MISIPLLLPRLAKAASWRLALLLLLMAGNLLIHAPLAQVSASAGKRIALVIGNDNYQSVSKLQKAGNDAKTMARELKEAGFEVLLHQDLNYRDMVKAVAALAGKISGGDQVLVFFAGHGVQTKSGSYLLPTDIEIGSESEVEQTAYSLNALTDKLSEAKASFTLVMVDACRDNPLKVNGRSVGEVRGLSAIEPPKGQMVVYSASKGQQALDRLSDNDSNPNGVFTREFIAKMRQPGVRIEDLMREVQDAVETLAKKVGHEQRPAIYNEARGNFYFFGPTTVQVPSGTATDAETDLWREIKASGTRDYLEAYLKQYPKGKYLVLAKLELKKIDDADKAQRTKQEQEQKQTAEQTRQEQQLAADAQQAQAEQQAWAAAKASETRDDLEAYLKQYPKGKFLALAKLELKKLDDADKAQRARQEQAQKQAAEQTRQEQLAAAQAARLQQQQTEQQAWASAKANGSPDAYASYLQNYPSGRYAALAQAARLKAQQEAAERDKQQAREAIPLVTQSPIPLVTQSPIPPVAPSPIPPFALSLSKGNEGFDKLSPNGSQSASQPASTAMPAASRYSTVGSNPITDCVKDQSTGLMWEGKPTSGERASDKTYTNYGDRRSGDASAYADTVNAMRLCGYSDWRLPTKDELADLVVKGVVPTIDGTWFPNTQARWYWSSTPSRYGVGYAWGIHFISGDADDYGNRDYFYGYLRLVRETEKPAQQDAAQREREAQALRAQQASPPASTAMPASSRYGTVGSNPITDCVKDQSTGLMWEGKPVSGERASGKRYTNYGDKRSGDASTYADTVNAMRLCGYSDWRLPTKDELAGLVVKGVRPTIDGTWFPNTQASWYWSSTHYGAGGVWFVDFNDGYAGDYGRYGYYYYLRLVR